MNTPKTKAAPDFLNQEFLVTPQFLTGTATVKVQMKPTQLETGTMHPAELFGQYVQEQVSQLMEQFHCIPSSVTVRIEGEE